MKNFCNYIQEKINDAYRFYQAQCLDDGELSQQEQDAAEVDARNQFENTLRSLLDDCVRRGLPESEIRRIFDDWSLYNPYRDWVEE